MKIKCMCNSSTDDSSLVSEIIDLEKDWLISNEEWKNMCYTERFKLLSEWALVRVTIDWEEILDK